MEVCGIDVFKTTRNNRLHMDMAGTQDDGENFLRVILGK